MNSSSTSSRRALFTALAVAAAFLPLTGAAAVSAVSNLGETSLGNGGIVFHIVSNASIGQAGSFVTGPGGVTLDSVDLLIGNVAAGSTGFTVELFSDLAGLPGGLLAALAGPNPAGSDPDPSLYSYVAPPNTLLAPNTAYWVAATATPGSGYYEWWETDSNAETPGLPGWSIANFRAFSDDGGQTWSADSGFKLMLQVNVTEVPESSTWAAASAMALMTGVAWRRRKKAGIQICRT